MKIAAVASVKDAVDILPKILGNLRNQGVEEFFILDHGSVDGTGEYLAHL